MMFLTLRTVFSLVLDFLISNQSPIKVIFP